MVRIIENEINQPSAGLKEKITIKDFAWGEKYINALCVCALRKTNDVYYRFCLECEMLGVNRLLCCSITL